MCQKSILMWSRQSQDSRLLYCSFLVLNSFKLNRSVFLQNCAVNLDTCTLITIPRSHASQKYSIHEECSQKVIETNLILHSTPHVFGQPSPDHSIVVHPDCVRIVLKQINFGTMAMSLHEIFASFYRKEFIEITETARQCTNA